MTIAEFDEEAVVEVCRRRGLEIRAVEREGTVLLLHPASTGELPDADRLGEIAEALDLENIRYVTLAMDEYRSEGQDGEIDE